jgi:TPR repeat protein
MTKEMLKWLAAVSLFLTVNTAAPVFAGFQEGVKAYEAGEYQVAFDEWLPLARNNDPAAMRNLGHMYRRGLGVEQDYKQALNWYKRAATIGFDRAQANVAGMYLNGEGVDQDYEQAAMWFARAAQQGHVIAQYNLGLMFENGLGVEKNETQALGWFNLAAKAGHPQAIDRVSQIVAHRSKNGEKVPDSQVQESRSTSANTPAPIAKVVTAEPRVTIKASEPAEGLESDTPDSDPTARKSNQSASSDSMDEEKTASVPKATETSSVKKKGFYEALKSLVVTSSAASAQKEDIADPAPDLKSGQKLTDTKAAEVKAPTLKEQPVKVVSVSRDPAPVTVSANSGTQSGLTLDEKLEMADLAFTLQEYQESLSIWAALAQQGNAEAQYKLGTLFHSGKAVPIDRVRAYYWWEKAKENGSSDAASAIAELEQSLTYMEKRQISRIN